MVRRRSQRGFALLLALAVLLLVAVAVLLALQTAISAKSSLQRERREIALRAASDAALAETMAALDEDPSGAGVPRHSFGRAVIGSTVVPRSEGDLDVVAVAREDGREMTLCALVHVGPGGRVSIVSWHRSTVRSVPRGNPSIVTPSTSSKSISEVGM